MTPAFNDLPGLLASVPDQALLAVPALAAFVTEYSCWELQLAEWHGRRIPNRHDGYHEWIREGRALFDRYDELTTMADDLLRGE